MTASGVVTVIQARVGSTRLPGKVLLPLCGPSVLDVLLSRVCAAERCGTVVVATTPDPADDAIVRIAEGAGVAWHRGHPTDLLDRHLAVADRFGARHVVKIPSDCPFIDPAAIDAVLGAYLDEEDALDYASNLHPPTWPDGNDVEVLRIEVLRTAWREAEAPYEREHTTPFVWDQPNRFRLRNVRWGTGRDCSQTHRLVLDFPEDYAVLRALHAALGAGADVDALALVAYLDTHEELAGLNACHRDYQWYHAHAQELRTLGGRGETASA